MSYILDLYPPGKTHVMVDLETWGQGNDAMPVSLGAVKFTRDSIVERFHVGIDPVSAERFGRKIDAGTILWWMDADRREALDAWLALPKVDIDAALCGFYNWGAQTLPEQLGGLWGNGAAFDNVILRNAYNAVGIGELYPVKFRKDWCYRTLKATNPDIAIERVGLHHSAVDDAETQALHLQRICAARGIAL